MIHVYIVAEELLIDFRELIGEHSGENMAEAVWATTGAIRPCWEGKFPSID